MREITRKNNRRVQYLKQIFIWDDRNSIADMETVDFEYIYDSERYDTVKQMIKELSSNPTNEVCKDLEDNIVGLICYVVEELLTVVGSLPEVRIILDDAED